MSSSDVRASADTGVAGVCGTRSCVEEPTLTSFMLGAFSSKRGFGISQSTLSGSKGNKPALAHPARMFREVNVFKSGYPPNYILEARIVQQDRTLISCIKSLGSCGAV
jgi:hypothetical protein